MNLYLIEREAPPGRPRGFVVAAASESQARRRASQQADGEPGPWLDPDVTACARIGVTIAGQLVRPGVVLRERAEPRR